MPLPRPAVPGTRTPQDQLLERIAQRYEQLEEQLEAIEAKLLSPDMERSSEPPTASDRPRQPR